MLSPADEARLCEGRVVWVNLYNSRGTDAAGEHPAVILDADGDVRDVIAGKLAPQLFVVVISHDTTIDPPETRMPVPARWGLTGHVQGRWVEQVPLAAITRVDGAKANELELTRITALIRGSAGK